MQPTTTSPFADSTQLTTERVCKAVYVFTDDGKSYAVADCEQCGCHLETLSRHMIRFGMIICGKCRQNFGPRERADLYWPCGKCLSSAHVYQASDALEGKSPVCAECK